MSSVRSRSPAPIFGYGMNEIRDEKFKRDFWEWFDSLTKNERQKFQYYTSDMSEIYFYNKIYRYKEEKNCPSSPTGRGISLRN